MKPTNSPRNHEHSRPRGQFRVRTNLAGHKLMAALNEIIQAERAPGVGLTVRVVLGP